MLSPVPPLCQTDTTNFKKQTKENSYNNTECQHVKMSQEDITPGNDVTLGKIQSKITSKFLFYKKYATYL